VLLETALCSLSLLPRHKEIFFQKMGPVQTTQESLFERMEIGAQVRWQSKYKKIREVKNSKTE